MIKASSIYMIGRALTALLTIASIAIFSRLLVPTDYGSYTLMITTAGIFNALFCTWVAQSVFRFYSETEDKTRLNSTAAISLVVCASFSAATVIIIIILSGKPLSGELFFGILLLFTGYSFYEYSNVQLTAQQQPYVFAQLQLVKLLLSLVLPLLAWFASLRFDHFMLAFGAAFWLPLFLPRFSTWASGLKFCHFDWKLLKSLARYGLPLSLSLLLMQLGIGLDRYMLGAYRGVDFVAGYAAGADMALFSVGMIASSLSQAFYPRLLQLHGAGDTEDATRLYSEYIVLFIALLLPASVGLFFVSDELAWLIVGEAIRADTATSLTLFSASAFILNFKSFIVDVQFQIAKKMLFPILSSVAIVGLLACFGFLWIPSYAGAGAAWAILIAVSIGCLIAMLSCQGIFQTLLVCRGDLAKICFAVVTMVCVLELVDERFAPLVALTTKVIAGMTVYGATLFILNFRPLREGFSYLTQCRVRRNQF